MFNKFVLTLATVGVMTLSAASATYKVSILQNSVVDGKQLKAGDYKVEMKDNNTAVLKHGKEAIELPAREETSPQKFSTTEMQYTNNNDLQEIRIGNTHTRIVFGGSSNTANGTE